MRFTDTLPAARKFLLAAGGLLLVAACSSGGGAPNASTGYGAPLSNKTPAGGAVGGASGAPSAAPGSPGINGAPAAGAAEVSVRVTMMMQLGSFLTDGAGRTLYVFRKDGPDSSACTGGCATAWPALTVGSGKTVTADPAIGARISTFERPDGTLQVAFDKAPLYYFGGDSTAGDTNGQGIGGVWFVAAITGGVPAASAPAQPAAGGYGGS